MEFNYSIIYEVLKTIANADALSRRIDLLRIITLNHILLQFLLLLSLNPMVLPTLTASSSVIQVQPPLVNDETGILLGIDTTQLHNGRRTVIHNRDSVATRKCDLVHLIPLDVSPLDQGFSKQNKLASITAPNLETPK